MMGSGVLGKQAMRVLQGCLIMKKKRLRSVDIKLKAGVEK
jgi:hypothetical protein